MDKDNAVKIRPDLRLPIISAIRSVSLLCLLLLAVFSVWHYRDDLNAASGKQLIAYIKSASYSDVLFEKYESGTGLSVTCAPLGVGMAVVESDYYHYVAGNNRVEFSSQLKYSSPVIENSDDWALIYDAGNTSYSVVTGYAVTKSGTTEGSIITGAVSESGQYAIVSKAAGYRSSVTVFSKKHKQLCSWDTPSEYIMMVSIAPDGESFAALSLYTDGEEMLFRLTNIDTYTGQKRFEKTLDCSAVYSLRHTQEGKLMLLCDNGVKLISKNGSEKKILFDADKQALAFYHGEEDMCLVVFKGNGINTLEVCIFGSDGELAYFKDLEGDLRACHLKNGKAALLLDNSLVWYDGEKWQTLDNISARGVISDNRGTPVLVYTDRIERIETE